jgi:hypothetical protein
MMVVAPENVSLVKTKKEDPLKKDERIVVYNFFRVNIKLSNLLFIDK